MYMNISSFWVLLGDGYEYLKDYAVLLTMILCGIEIYIFINLKKWIYRLETIIYVWL